jgi:hypothetical protein
MSLARSRSGRWSNLKARSPRVQIRDSGILTGLADGCCARLEPMTGGEAIGRRDALAQTLLPYILVLLIPFGLAFAPNIFNDGDVSWHVAAGRWMLAHGTIPRTDPFSFTAAGRPWVAMEWPADLVFAGAYGAAGHAGLAAVFAAALMALHAVVFVHLRQRASPLLIVATLLLMDVALAPFMLVRPHVLIWPLLALWTALLARGSETGRPPPLWAALIPFAWTNLHGSFPLAAGIGAALAFDALVKAEWKTLREWLVFAAASLVAVCVNANGAAGLLQPFRVADLETSAPDRGVAAEHSVRDAFVLSVPVRRTRRPFVAGDAGAAGTAGAAAGDARPRLQPGAAPELVRDRRRAAGAAAAGHARGADGPRAADCARRATAAGRARAAALHSARECGQPAAFARRHPAGAQGPAGVQRLYVRRAADPRRDPALYRRAVGDVRRRVRPRLCRDRRRRLRAASTAPSRATGSAGRSSATATAR